MSETTTEKPTDFIRAIIAEDLASGKNGNRVATRFPPEPNGYLHIGHAKAFGLNFSIAQEGPNRTCNLRFDDTNPIKEEDEYVDAIMEDIRWMGYEWDNLFFASDYFPQLYDWAVQLIKAGKAYVDDLSADEIREYRGTLTEPGKNSPYRDRSVEENLDLFARMKKGEFPDGSRVLRAKIDMASPIINLRDPVMYRILHATHHRTGDEWCIYPMYDWAHGQSDSIEGITHSLCSLEFVNHRPLYNWFLEELEIYHPYQYEFARLNITHTLMSKRKLRQLVEDGVVSGWDDPRMPTLRGMRRRGYTPEAIRTFIDNVGVARANSTVEFAMLEHAVRDDLNTVTPRVMAVLDPLKVVIENYPVGQTEWVEVPDYPQHADDTRTRKVPFSRELYIERDDFAEVPPRRYRRMTPGVEVRLFSAYYVTTTAVVKDAEGNVVEIHATYDPESRGGQTPDGRKVRGTIHWVSAEHAVDAEVRLYDVLFSAEFPEDVTEGQDFTVNLNPTSLETVTAKVEPSLADVAPGSRFQFMRNAYFVADSTDHSAEHPVFNRTVTLRDSWAKIASN